MRGAEHFRGFVPDFAYKLYDLKEYPDEQLALSQNMALSVVLYLFKHIFDPEFDQVFQQAADWLYKIKDETIYPEFLEWVLRYSYYARQENESRLREIIDRETDRLGDQRIRRTAMSVAEEIRKKGWKEGREEERAYLVLKLIRKRFGDIPSSLEKRVKGADLGTLELFTDSIFDFKDLNDVQSWWESDENR
jgi:hypothetical protein